MASEDEEFCAYEVSFVELRKSGKEAHRPFLKEVCFQLGAKHPGELTLLRIDTVLKNSDITDYKAGMWPEEPGAWAFRYCWRKKTEEEMHRSGLGRIVLGGRRAGKKSRRERALQEHIITDGEVRRAERLAEAEGYLARLKQQKKNN